MLAEGFLEPAPFADPPPPELTPRRAFTIDAIRDGLPEPAPFRFSTLRFCR
jgi:hypothetical protein